MKQKLVPSGFRKLDEIIEGFAGGNLYVIGARPSMDKTSFALSLVANILGLTECPSKEYLVEKSSASDLPKKSVVYFSSAISKENILKRLLSQAAQISIDKISSGDLNEDDWCLLSKTSAHLADSQFYIDDTAHLTIGDFFERCHKLNTTNGLDLIVLDDLQLLSHQGLDRTKDGSYETLCALKRMAQKLACPIVLLAQLNRESAKRQDPRPVLSDFRLELSPGSIIDTKPSQTSLSIAHTDSSIESVSDVVLILFRPGYHFSDKYPDDKIEIIVAKNRNGPLGATVLGWDRAIPSIKNPFVRSDSENEYDAAIERDFLASRTISIDQHELTSYREILADLEAAKHIYGESLEAIIAHYRELFPGETEKNPPMAAPKPAH